MTDFSRINRKFIESFAKVFDAIPAQGPARGPSVNDETDYADDFDRMGMREVESGKKIAS